MSEAGLHQQADGSFCGVWPVLATPFLDDGVVDWDSFGSLATHVAALGVGGVLFPGFASEFPKLSEVEALMGVSCLAELARTGHVPRIMASVSEHSTYHCCRVACAFVDAGANAINLLPPHRLNPPPEAVAAHVAALLAAVDPVEVIVQVAPNEAGGVLNPNQIARLRATHANLTGAKVEATPPYQWIEQLRKGPVPLPSFVGYAGLYLPGALASGAVGVMPGSGFVELYTLMWRHWTAGDVDAFRLLHSRLLPYLVDWMSDVEHAVATDKHIAMRRGLIRSDMVRQPGWVIDDRAKAQADHFIDEFAELLLVRGDSGRVL